VRKHRVIRQVSVGIGESFAMDIETGQFKALMVTWDATASDDPSAIPIVCPTVNRPGPLTAVANFPGVPANVPAFSVAYLAIGIDGQAAFPIPEMITIGVINSFDGDVLTLKIEGDEYESRYPNPEEAMKRNRA
jgi:hypothetical protein